MKFSVGYYVDSSYRSLSSNHLLSLSPSLSIPSFLLGIYREAYLVRKPAQFIADYEFYSDITIPIAKSKKPKKAFSELDDLMDNIQEAKEVEEKKAQAGKERALTAIVTVNILTEGMVEALEKADGALEYAIRAEMFENGALQSGSVLTMTGLVKKVRMAD
jgi:hypothetical protein